MIRMHAQPNRPDMARLSRDALYERCWAGELPAEVLDPKDRERLVADLWEFGWTDREIAAHTRMTTYTTARIRERQELLARRPVEGAA